MAFTNIDALLRKQDNQEAKENAAEVPNDEKLTAKEFVEKIVQPIIELQKDATNTVRSISRNGVVFKPENGVVTLPSDETTVTVLCENNLSTIVSADGTCKVKLAFTSVQGGGNTYEIVDVQVRAFRNGAYTTIGTFSAATSDYNNPQYVEYDLSKYGLVNGTYENLLVVATGKDTMVNGRYQFASIVLTTLSLRQNRNYYTPIVASEQSGRFPIAYYVLGAVQKVLHVSVKGTSGTTEVTYDLDPTMDAVSVQYNITDNGGLLTHGVKEVTAWLTCSDGVGGTLSSDKLVNRFMVVNPDTPGADLTKPYLMLQNVISKASNFVQVSICDYAVFSPKFDEEGKLNNDGEAVDVAFLLTDYSEVFGNWKEEYLRIENKVKPGVANTLKTTIEIEGSVNDDESDSYDSYLRVTRTENGRVIDFLNEAQGIDNIHIIVDNKDSFAPYKGSNFLLNPKVRNNTESNPARILNARNNNAEVGSTWSGFGFINDGWISDSQGNKVLRVPAGARLNIDYNPFAQFATTPDSSMTLDIDFAVRNVADEDDVCIAINEIVAATSAKLGLFIQPIHGAIYTASNQAESECDFYWEEEARNHISINICNAVIPNRNDALVPVNPESDLDVNSTQIALVRVFINGVIKREMRFNTASRTEFCTSATSHGGITIGQDNCDIDIYSIRCYQQSMLSSEDILKNRISTIPTAEEKLSVRRANAMTTAGKIDVEKVKALGRRVLIWHGKEPYKYATDGQKGWWEIHQYNEDLTENLEYSGTICKDTACLSATRQGSTANTYYYSNLQTKADKTDKITIALSRLHSSIQKGRIDNVTDEDGNVTGQVIWLIGGNLGAYEPVAMSMDELDEKGNPKNAKTYTYFEENGEAFVKVPDGWIDGNGKYRGLGFCIAPGTPQATKLVNKVNYASSMQGHLAGCCRMYSDLHTAVVGKNSLQDACDTARVAKFNLPFYFFTQAPDSNEVVFRGGCNFGGGKMDKPTWGYVKKKHPNFAMIEGSDNNYDLTDFRVPFDKYDVKYRPEQEGWFYNGLQQWDFDAGATDEDTEYQDKDGNNYETPKKAIVDIVAEAINFVYMHAPNIAYFAGTFSAFQSSAEAGNTTKKYWCTQGDEAYCLKRYRAFAYNERYVDENGETKERSVKIAEWVDAGLPIGEKQLTNGDGQPLYYVGRYSDTASTLQSDFPVMQAVYGKVVLTTDEMTKDAYENSTNKAQYSQLNQQFINAIVAHAKKYIGWYFKPASLRFHYAFINHLMAGTDNCSKNTYFVIDPKAVNVTIDGETKTCYLFEMHQDDVDTIIPTDNNGRTTKPYYVDRMHPYPDGSNTSCYEGMNNQLFNLIEQMYEGTRELQSTLKSIFSAMSSLVDSTDNIPGMEDSTSKVSVWGFLNKYLFSINRYFSEVAYNEQARIRYEYPAMLKYTSRGSGARGVAPITQSMGNALESELQWMKRRLVYMGSYAAWGPFYDAKSGELGIGGANDTFSLQAFHLPHQAESNNNYKFKVVPHQYIYPTGQMGQTVVDPHTRIAPGESFELDLGDTTTNDTGLSLNGVNFYKSIGNVGDLSTTPANTVTVNGKRLVEFIAEPTKFYEDPESHEMVPAFRPSSIDISATNIKKFSLKGCKQIGATLNASALTRLEELDLRQTNIYDATLPRTATLTTVRYADKFVSVDVENMENLKTLTLEGYYYVSSVSVSNCPKLDTQDIIASLYTSKMQEGATKLDTLKMTNIKWGDQTAGTGVSANVLQYLLGVHNVSLTGYINVPNTSSLNAATKFMLIEKFGDVDSSDNPLYITYRNRNMLSVGIDGNIRIRKPGKYKYSLIMNPTEANNFKSLRWSLQENQYATIDEITGVLTVTNVVGEEFAQPTAKLTCTIDKVDGTSVTAEMTLYLYNRVPKLGDWAYSDGEFDSVLYPNKTVVGWVYKVSEIEADEDGNRRFECLVQSAEQSIRLTTSDGSSINITSMPWGIYANNDGNSIPNAVLDEMATLCGVSARGQISDIPEVPNNTTGGLRNEANTGSDNYIRHYNAYDLNAEDGFKVFTAGSVNEDWNGKAKTEAIVAHAQKILVNFGEQMVRDGKTISDLIGKGDILPKNNTELADLMFALQTIGGTVPYIQMAYPAAYSCKLYEPTAENLHEQYARGNWYLPAQGDLTRLYIFHRNSKTANPTVSSSTADSNSYTPSANYANEHPDAPSLTPAYSNLLKRAADLGVTCPVAMMSQSYTWSSTEYNSTIAWPVYFGNGGSYNGSKFNSYVVRPVVAFTFVL